MIVTMEIPDDLADDLQVGFQNLNQAALEALAADAYSKELLSLEQVRRMLNLESRWDAEAILSKHSAWPGLSAEEIFSDARTAAEFRHAAS
jgi:hypothetical protein